MRVVPKVSPPSLAHPPSSHTLPGMTADHELVLGCACDTAAPRLVCAVRLLLPRHPVVTLLVDPGLLCHDHDLLAQILNDGHRPVVLATGEATAVQLSAWLCADTDVVLTAGPGLAVAGQADM
jgi:hypothetical protein